MYEAFGSVRKPAVEVLELVESTAHVVNQLTNEQTLLRLEEAEARVANVIFDYLKGHIEQIDDLLELEGLPRNNETIEVQKTWHDADRKHLFKEVGKVVAGSVSGETFREALHGKVVNVSPLEGIDPTSVFSSLDKDEVPSNIPTSITGTVVGTSLIHARLSIQSDADGRLYQVHVLGDEDPRADRPKAQIMLDFIETKTD